MGYPSVTEIAVGRFYAIKDFCFDHPDISYLFLKEGPLPDSLTRYLNSFDMIVSFLTDGVFTENLKRVSRGYVLSHDPFPRANANIHIVDHLLSALGGCRDVTQEERIPRVFLKEENKLWASDFLDRHFTNRAAPIVALHPGSGGRKKCWPVENFVSLALHLKKEMEAQLLVVSGPADEEVAKYLLNNFLLVGASASGGLVPLLNLPLPKLAALLEKCNLFVGNDSGITHLAVATGTNTLALFGPTDPAIWGPRGKCVKIIRGKVACSPCSSEERGRCQRPICMEAISPREVIETAEEIFKSIFP